MDFEYPIYIKLHNETYKVTGEELLYGKYKNYKLECISNKKSLLVGTNKIDPKDIIQNQKTYTQLKLDI